MASRQGDIFNAILAIGPPATTAVAMILGYHPLTALSLSSRTLLGGLYALGLYHFVYAYFKFPFKHLPSPPNVHPILAKGFSIQKRPPGSEILKWIKTTPNEGMIAFKGIFHLGNNLVLTTPEVIMQVLNAHSYDWEKPAQARRFLAGILGNGLVNVEGNEHKWQRKHVTPAFSGRIIRDLIPLFWQKASALTDAVDRERSTIDNSMEIKHIASRVTLDIIGAAGIGKDFDTVDNEGHDLAAQYHIVTNAERGNLAVWAILNMTFPPSILRHLPIDSFRVRARAIDNIRHITKELLEEKKRAMQDENVVQKDIIATLIRSGDFTDDGLTDQLLTFLAAGHETTAASLTWVLYLLSRHPDAQERLRKECQDRNSKLESNTMSADILDSMEYLEAVCNETLRIYPTVPITSRVACRPTKIFDQPIPKGTFVIICPWAIHRSPDLWGQDAEEFRPDRWLGEKGKHGGAVSPYAFITFLHGPRSCIGQSFARYELKCLLMALMLRFQFRLKKPEEIPVPDGAVTIKPRNGMELIITDL